MNIILPLFVLWFYSVEFIWILSGFFDFNISLTTLWLPFSIILFLGSAHYKIPRRNLKFPIILLFFSLWLIIFISMWINFFQNNCIPPRFYFFSFVLWTGIILISVSIYKVNLTLTDIRKLIKIFLLINLFVIAISILIEIGVFTDLLPTSLFWLNPKYTVIGFSFLDNLFIRNPGIFESGATNAEFLYHMTLLYLTLLIFKNNNIINNKKTLLILLSINILLIFLTFTRRFIAFIYIFIFMDLLLVFLKTKKYKYLFISIILLTILITIIFLTFPMILELFNSKSLLERLNYWNLNIKSFDENFNHFFYGFSLLQLIVTNNLNSIGYFSCLPITIIDNIYLASLMYGGIFFLFLLSIYFIFSIAYPLKVFFKSKDNTNMALSLYLFSTNLSFLMIGIFGNWLVNFQESFIFWVLNQSILSYFLGKIAK